VRAAVLTGDGGDGGAPINFAEGKTVMGAPNSLRASAGGGGSSQARWSEARRSGMEEIEGEEGGGSGGLSSGKWRAARHVERGARERRVEGRMEEGPGSVSPRRGGRPTGAWQSARCAAGRDSGRSGVCYVSRGAGWHAWAARAGVGQPKK
jgi:hypothetical protein